MFEWLFFTVLAILIQGLFALFEMSCVSFNRIRLAFYVSRRDKRSIWINFLLSRPSRLFGTTLIGINTALQIGSECSRRFYESIHLDPDLAPITQVFLVVIFGELVPMFTARRHPERIAIALSPLMICIAKILTPITWTFDQLSKGVNRLISKQKEAPLFLSREEVMMAFQKSDSPEDEFNVIADSIFQLKNYTAGQLMCPLEKTILVPSTATVGEVRKQLAVQYVPILPIYHQKIENVIYIVSPRDLLRLSDTQKIIEQGKSPWIENQDTPVLQLLESFRRNNQSVAVIRAPTGEACGILTLDQIIDAILGPEEKRPVEEEDQGHFIKATVMGAMTIAEFNAVFEEDLTGDPEMTLHELIVSRLDHPPSLDESVRIDNYKFTVQELTLRGIKKLSVETI